MGTNEYVVTREELIAQGCTEKCSRNVIYFEDTLGCIVAKRCTSCREVLSLGGYGVDKRGLGERRSGCRECRSKDEIRYRKANPEKERERKRKFREDFPEKLIERSRKYREDYPEKRRDSSRRWYEANLEKQSLKRQLRRARKAVLPDTLTIKQQSDIILRFKGMCALTDSTDYHMDHVIPITVGRGGTTYENMVTLRADLNLSKNASHLFEWFNSNRERFGLSQAKFDTLISYLAEVNGMTTKEYRMYVDWCFDNPRDISELEATG